MKKTYCSKIKNPGCRKFDIIAKYLRKYNINDFKNIIDIGGEVYSQKFLYELIPQANIIIFNIDIDETKGCENVIIGNAENISKYTNYKFDCAMCLDMIEHLNNPDSFLVGLTQEDFEKPPKTPEYNPQVYKGWNGKLGKSKYSQVLNKKALFILSTPNLANLFNRIALLFGFDLYNYNPSNQYRLGIFFKKYLKILHIINPYLH